LFIRQILTKRVEADPLTIALAFAANRLDHCDRVIRPFLNDAPDQHRVVICDRYYLSSLVYQTNNEISIEEVMNLNRKAMKPDLIMFFNASNKVCAERMKKRDQEKELFEKDLNETRKKYLKAIEYLESRGETVVEIDANGSQDDVLVNMITALNNHSPEWLKEQPAFRLNYEAEVINVNGGNGITLEKEAQNLFDRIMPYQFVQSSDMNALLNKVEDKAKEVILGKTIDELGYLFLDYLRINNFAIGEKFSWSDVDAFYVDYALPLSVNLRGIVILGNEIHKEMIVQRKMAYHKFDALSFIFLFLPAVRQKENYFESEYLVTGNEKVLAPSIRKFYKDDLAVALISQVVKKIQSEFSETILAFPKLKSDLVDFCLARNLIRI
jgi:dTMP kinase